MGYSYLTCLGSLLQCNKRLDINIYIHIYIYIYLFIYLFIDHGEKEITKVWITQKYGKKEETNNLREKFTPGPGFEPVSPALRAGAPRILLL